MPDPNDLTAEEKEHAKRYAKQADAAWAKVAAGKLEGVAPPKPVCIGCLQPVGQSHLANCRYATMSEPKIIAREPNQIMVDALKFEHLLNCMAQLDFLPMTENLADEAIIRKAYHEARDMLNSATLCSVPPPPTVQIEQLSQGQFKPGQTVWLVSHSQRLTVISQHKQEVWVQQDDLTSWIEQADRLTATDPNRPVRKFKVGDAVLLPGVVVEVDDGDTELPYKVKFGEVTGPGEDYDYVWFTEAYLTEAYLVEGSR